MSLSPRRIQAVIFDLDDTLLDWSTHDQPWQEITGAHLHHVHRYLTQAGYTLPEESEFLALYLETLVNGWETAKKTWAGVSFGQVLTTTLQQVGLPVNQIDLRAVMEAYEWEALSTVGLYPDAHDVLGALQTAAYKIGLITNSMMPMWMRDIELDTYGIIDYFDCRVTSGDIGYMKPHPAIYERVLDALGVAAETAVFVGDRPANDIAGANAAGMVSVWMNPPHVERPLHGVQPDYTITQLSQLLPILQQLEAS